MNSFHLDAAASVISAPLADATSFNNALGYQDPFFLRPYTLVVLSLLCETTS